jgi:hypothetical protein
MVRRVGHDAGAALLPRVVVLDPVPAPPRGVADEVGIDVAGLVGAVPAGEPEKDLAAVIQMMRGDRRAPFEEEEVDVDPPGRAK